MTDDLSDALWGAQLDHLTFTCPDPAQMADFYGSVLGLAAQQTEGQSFLLSGPGRRIVIRPGEQFDQTGSAFRFKTAAALERYRTALTAGGLNLKPHGSPLLADGFAVADPDGRDIQFGITNPDIMLPVPADTTPPGRLQHVVVATTDLGQMIRFYEQTLGFRPSDYVVDEASDERPVTAAFYRSDPEHHSFAVFRADSSRPDHHAYEVECWNDIRDWADRLAERDIQIWWGPGRHGVGNNLFFMIEDPWGYKIELSAELETVPAETEVRTWAHGPRALNLWGNAWMRS